MGLVGSDPAEHHMHTGGPHVKISLTPTALGHKTISLMNLRGDRDLDGIPENDLNRLREVILTLYMEDARGGSEDSSRSSLEPLCRRLLSVREDVFGSEHIRLVEILMQLGKICDKAGRLKESEGHYFRAVSIAEETREQGY